MSLRSSEPERESTADMEPDPPDRSSPPPKREPPPPPPPAPVATAAPRWQRAYLVTCCAIIGAAFAYCACDWGKWTKLAYLPLQERATFSPEPGAIVMWYPGIILWGLGGLACGAVAGGVIGKLFPRPWSARTLHLFGGWAVTAVLLAGAYWTWNLWPW